MRIEDFDNMRISSLHNHDDRSNIRLIDAISRPNEILDKAYELNFKGIAITNHECLSSFVAAENYLNKKIKEEQEKNKNLPVEKQNYRWKNLKFIRGNEIYLCRNGLCKENFVRKEDKFYHFILLAKDYKGYQQLNKLSKRAWSRSFKYNHVRVPTYYQDLIEIISPDKGHIICSTACIGSFLGEMYKKVLRKEISIEYCDNYCIAWINRICEIVGKENLYLEIQPSNAKDQRFYNTQIIKLSKILNLKVIITTDSHYINKEDKIIHKQTLKSKNGERETDSFYATTYIMSAREIAEYFKDYVALEDIKLYLENTNEISDRIENYSLFQPLKIPYLPKEQFDEKIEDKSKIELAYIFENSPTLKKYYVSEHNYDNQFAVRIINELYKKEEGTCRYTDINNIKRVEKELNIILDSSIKNKADWSKYFLQVSDYVKIYWTLGDSFVGPSRGSAGSSYICYLMGIIQINPLREKAKLYFERFMNPDRASVLDIDLDIESNKRNKCIAGLEEVYGKDHVTRVSTFKKEKTKSTIQTACRCLGIDVDTARNISGIVKTERGIDYSLSEMYYGDKEKGISPNKEFIMEMNKRPELWELAQRIEGLITGVSVHAGGVVITEEKIEDLCGVMKTTGNDIVTAYDLHEIEQLGAIKIDLLATKALSIQRTCIDLLVEQNYIKKEGKSLRDIYEEAIGVYNIDRYDKDKWEFANKGKILSLFQMEQQSGIQGMQLTKPSSLEDIAILSSVMRLMPTDKTAERPLEKFARFKKDSSLWEEEMDRYNLTEEEKQLMHSMFDYCYGIGAHQEDLYQLMRNEKIAGFSFGKADQLRKCIAKKIPEDYLKFEKEFWETVREKGSSYNLCNYIWNVIVATQRGYSFNLSHSLAYAIVTMQEIELAYKYPLIFWNTANLIINSGYSDTDGDLEEPEEEEEEVEINNAEIIGNYIVEDDPNDEYYELFNKEEIEVDGNLKKKAKKKKSPNYGKIAAAIGQIQSFGIKVLPPDINISGKTYTPFIDSDKKEYIYYGLKGITKVGEDVVEEILQKRPYSSFEDFENRVKVKIDQKINLIKSGAFDFFGDRKVLINKVITVKANLKKSLNLRNLNQLITRGIINENNPETQFPKKVFCFNNYIKKACLDKKNEVYILDNNAYPFYEKNFSIDLLTDINKLKVSDWNNIYSYYSNFFREYIKENHDFLLNSLNESLIKEQYEKYATGSIEKWSMDSLNYYQGKHELADVNLRKNGLINFSSLPQEPEIDYSFETKDGYEVKIFKLHKICGTVIDKNKSKKQITLLTTEGVVTVMAYGIMNSYDATTSIIGNDGKKHRIENSLFQRGNKIIVLGFRRGRDTFVAKKYKNMSEEHHFRQIVGIDENGFLQTKLRLFQMEN